MKKFKKFNTYNLEEIKAGLKVLKSGNLSSFIGAWEKGFYGGKKIIQMEKNYAKAFNVKYAISVNSWTSGLICAVGAIGINPGDEVILPPWTMSACASSILHWNAIPVFADIEEDTLCIDPESIKKNITKKTKAIMCVDISGKSSNLNEIKKIARKHNLKIISDSAQSPFATYNGKKCGTLVDIGGISLNYHKHIHTGEGGVIFTNNKLYSEKCKMIRNHGEAVLKNRKFPLNNMLGNNFRMGELEAAIAIEQLKKLYKIVKKRERIANYLTKGLKNIKGIKLPKIHNDLSNVYYTYPIILRKEYNFDRKKILGYFKKYNISNMGSGYENLHLLPLFQNKQVYGNSNFPWKSEFNKRNISYKKGICPIAEIMNDKLYIGYSGISYFDLNKIDIDYLVKITKTIFNKRDIYL